MPLSEGARPAAWCARGPRSSVRLGPSLQGIAQRLVSRLHVTHDETTGEPHTAGIMLFDRNADGTGHASLTCLDHQPAPELMVLVYEPRSAERLAEHTSETLRIHVDAQPMWRLGPVAVADVPQTDDGRGTVAYGVTLRRGFHWELAAGERLIVQIGELPILSLDVAAAKPDIVEFKAACDRMYANRMLPRHRWAELDFRDPDPLTGEPSLSLELFHEASHDGGNQPRFQLSCGNDARHVGTDSVDLVAHRARHWGRAATRTAPTRPAQTAAAGRDAGGSTSDLRIQVDDGSVRAIAMASRAPNPDRWGTFDLPPDENPVRDLVGVLEAGRAMTIRWFHRPPVRFDLAGGRPAIAAFRARCEEMFDQTRSDAGGA